MVDSRIRKGYLELVIKRPLSFDSKSGQTACRQQTTTSGAGDGGGDDDDGTVKLFVALVCFESTQVPS